MNIIALYIGATIAKIGEGFVFWMWLRQQQSPWWTTMGIVFFLFIGVFIKRSEAALPGGHSLQGRPIHRGLPVVVVGC